MSTSSSICDHQLCACDSLLSTSGDLMVSKPKILGTYRHPVCNPNEMLLTLRVLDVG